MMLSAEAVGKKGRLFEAQEAWKVPLLSDTTDDYECANFGVVREGYHAVVKGNSLHLHYATPTNDLPATTFTFDDKIDCIGWSRHGSDPLLVVGDRLGLLHFITPSLNSVLFSQALISNTELDQPIFADLQFFDGNELLVLMRGGNLTIFRNLSLLEFQSALETENNEDFIADLQSRIQLVRMDLSTMHGGSPSSILPLLMDNATGLVSTGRGPQVLCLWQRPANSSADQQYQFYDSVNFFEEEAVMVRCEATSCGKYLLTFSDCGKVCIWLLSSLIMVNMWTEPDTVVKDFCTFKRSHASLATAASDGAADSSLSFLNQSSDGLCVVTESSEGQVSLKVATLPDLVVLHSLDVPQSTQLFHGEVTEDALYYLEPTLQVMQLVQTQPEKKLAMLLMQHKFNEAERFATEYHIDQELVHKSKARVLSEQLSSTTSSAEDAEILTSLIQSLDKIEDEDFIMEMIFQFPYQTLELTLKMLHHANKKVKTPGLLMKVKLALNKLTTYQMIQGKNEFRSQSWLSFLAASSLEELKHYLSQGDFKSAYCIHDRHMGSLVSEVDETSLLSLLQCVPESVDSNSLGHWLSRYIVPFVLQHHPQSLSELLHWTEERTKLLELVHKENWPQNGVQLASAVLETISSFKNPSIKMAIRPHVFNMTKSQSLSPLGGLKSLQDSLSDLLYLHSSLQCTITLSQYESESREATVHRLLDKVVAVELVEAAVRSKVIPYVQKHDLKLDDVLLNYIKLFLMQSSWHISSGVEGSAHEAKVIALIQALQDKELQVMGCVELLRHVQAPWSEVVEELVQDCLAWDHPMVSNLRKQYRLLLLKKLLHGYGIREFNFSDSGRGWIYIRKILASGKLTALNDALEVANMYQLEELEVYKHHLVVLIQREKLDEALDMMASLPAKLKVMVANKSLTLASCKLQIPFHPELDIGTEREGAIRLVLLSLQVLEKSLKKGEVEVWPPSSMDEFCDVAAAIQLYKRLLALQVEYSVYLSPRELTDQGKCAKLFAEQVEGFVEGSSEGDGTSGGSTTTSSGTTHHRFKRFCRLLGYGEEEVIGAVVLSYARKGKLEKVKKLCRDLMVCDVSSRTASLLLAVIQEFWLAMERMPERVTRDDVEFIRSAASYATSFSKNNLLFDMVKVHYLCSFLSCLFSQCSEAELLDLSPSDEGSSFSHCLWSHRYNEDGLIMDKEQILPLAARFFWMWVPRSLTASSPSESPQGVGDSNSVLPLATELHQLLKDSNHTHLALHCIISTLVMLSQQVTAGAPLEADPLVFSQVVGPGGSVTSSLLNSLTTKVLSFRHVDHEYCLSLLLALSPSKAIPRLMAIKTHSISSYSRVIALCKLSIDYSLIANQPAIREKSSAILRAAEWGRKLTKLKISYTEAFRGGKEERKKVAATLLRAKEVDVDTVVQYCCSEVDQDTQSVLLMYLRVLLTEWEEPYKERALAVMSRISKTMIGEVFSNLLMTKVLPYDYTKISFLLQFLQNETTPPSLKVEQGLLILDCLKHYKRVAAPSEYERQWQPSKKKSTLNETGGMVDLPPMASNLLPFHHLLYGDPMKIIGPELSIQTVGKLTALARILKLPMDDFYSTSIKNITLSCDSHVITPVMGKSLEFDDISPLLNKIEEESFALTIAKWLSEHLCHDQSKIKALETALSIAQQLEGQAKTESEVKSARDRVGLFSSMLALKRTEELLRYHQLDQPKYLDLSGPALIMALYTDIPVAASSAKRAPPLHSIATKIAQFFNISLNKVQYKLYEQWLLSFGSAKKDMDTTQVSLLEDPTEETTEEEEEDEDRLNMKRLVYLLSMPEKLESNSVMLLNWAKRTSSSARCLSRVRALQVLFTIATPTMIETISGTSINDIKAFMQSAMFTCELEGLHISTTLAAFQSCNKGGLVKTLWKNHAREPKAVRLTCELCLYYDIGNSNLWAKLLEQLLHLSMLPYLRYLLKRLVSTSPDMNIPSLPNVWQKALTTPLETMSAPLSPFQREECDESLAMLHGCPFPFELDVGNLVELFAGLGLLSHALSCVLVIPCPKDQEKFTKLVLNGLKFEKYVELLNELNMDSTLLGNQQVKELIYTYLDHTERHEELLTTADFTDFVQFLISRKNIDKLLAKSLHLGRYQESVQLVEMYNRWHGCHTPTSSSGKEVLESYLSSVQSTITFNLAKI